MKILKIIFAIVVFVVLGYALFEWRYQMLVNEGTAILDKQCLNVDPLIIKRKNSYLNFIRLIYEKASKEEVEKEFKTYLTTSEKFIVEQKKWLNEQNKFMNRWDFKLILVEEIHKLSQLDYKSKELDVKIFENILKMAKTKDLNEQKKYYEENVNFLKTIEQINKEIDEIYRNKPNFSWRTIFIKAQPSKCPKENLEIPNVPDFFQPLDEIKYGLSS